MFFRPFIPIFQSQQPTTFAELFGADLAHLWDSYDDGTGVFTDSVSAFNVDDAGDNTPLAGTINGHTYPIFDGGAGSHALETSTDFSTLDDLDSWTIFGALKTNNGQIFGGIVEKPAAFYIEGDFSSGGIYVGISNSPGYEISGSIPIDDNQWHRFIITCNSGNMALYIDGGLDSTDAVIPIPGGIINPFFIGRQFSGTIDAGIAIVGIATRGINLTEVGYLDSMIEDYITVT